MVNWLLKYKPPRAKQTCNYCNSHQWGLARPNFPFCKLSCKQAYNTAVYRPPEQYELYLSKPPDTMPAS